MTMGRWIVLAWGASGMVEIVAAAAGYLMQRQDWIGWAIAGAVSLVAATVLAFLVSVSSPRDEDDEIDDEPPATNNKKTDKTT